MPGLTGCDKDTRLLFQMKYLCSYNLSVAHVLLRVHSLQVTKTGYKSEIASEKSSYKLLNTSNIARLA